MFRIGLKFPCNGLNRVKKHGYSRLYLTARFYETRARVKCEPDGRFCRDSALMSRISGPKYSTSSPKSDKSKGGTAVITIGAVALGAVGLLTLAKNNPEIRKTLEQWVPGTDKAIQIIFQEESTYLEFLSAYLSSLKQSILAMVFGDPTEKAAKAVQGQNTQKRLDCSKLEDYIPPKPAFEPLIDKKEQPINEPYAEIRVSTETKEKEEAIEVVEEKPMPVSAPVPPELMPENLVQLETYCGEAASKAIAAYQKAVCAMQDYNQEVVSVVESTGTTVANSVWDRLKEASEKRQELLQDAEKHANDALDSMKRMYQLIDEPSLQAPAHMKTVTRRNIKKILDDVDDAKKKYDTELQSSNVTERYWKQVKTARENFQEELQILFPEINIQNKKLSVSEEAFDLFVLHAYNKINNIQKELAKAQTIQEAKIRAALKATGEDVGKDKLEALIALETDKQRQKLEEEFSKKLLEEEKKFDDELRRQLTLQIRIHNDSLKETLDLKNRQMERSISRAVSEQTEAESIKHKQEMAVIVGRLRGLQDALKLRLEEEEGASGAQILWSACQALARAVKVAPIGMPAEKAVRPLEPEIKAVIKAAPKEDPLVKAAIGGIPEEAAKRGVYPENILRERFLKVEDVARRLALVPADGGSLSLYFLSYLQSMMIVKNPSPIPKSELEDEPINVAELNTFDILQRARYYIDRGDFKMSLRYMNLLEGAPRSIASEWMNEVRILLETQQAVDTLVAYAGAAGLVFLGGGVRESPKPKEE